MLAEARDALKRHQPDVAKARINRASALGGDPDVIKELTQKWEAEKKQGAIVPRPEATGKPSAATPTPHSHL